MTILACSTHALAVDSALFAGPVLMLAAAAWFAVRRERRSQRRRSQPAAAEAPGAAPHRGQAAGVA